MDSPLFLTLLDSSELAFVYGRPLEPYFGFHHLHRPDQDFDLDAYESPVADPEGYDASSESSEESDYDNAEFDASSESSEESGYDDAEFDASSESSGKSGYDDAEFDASSGSSEENGYDDAEFDASSESSEESGYDDVQFDASSESSEESYVDAAEFLSDDDVCVDLSFGLAALTKTYGHTHLDYLRDAADAIRNIRYDREHYCNTLIYNSSNDWLLEHIEVLKDSLTSWKADSIEHFSGRAPEFGMCLDIQYKLLARLHFFHKIKHIYMKSECMVSPLAVRGSRRRCDMCLPTPEFVGRLGRDKICPWCGPPQRYEHLEEMESLIEDLKTGIRLVNEAKAFPLEDHKARLQVHVWKCMGGHIQLKQLYYWHCCDSEWKRDDYITFPEFWERFIDL